MKLLIVFAALILVACGQTFDCGAALNKCDGDYNKSLPQDQGSHDIFCQITNVLIQCVEALASRVQCTNQMAAISKLRKKSQESITLHKCVGTAASTQCQADVDTCERTLVSDIAVAGHNAPLQCKAAAKFIACLDTRNKDPACATKVTAIADLRKKYQETFSNANCDSTDTPRENCNADVKACEDRFIAGVTKAGSDVNAACIAGSTLETCLQGRESLDECKDAKSTIDIVRKTYTEQIDADGCNSAHAMHCAQGITNCNNNYNTAIPSLTSATDQCKAANTYIDCLNAVSCSSAYKGQLQKGVTMVKNMVKDTSCTLKQLSGGAAQNVPILTALVSSLVAVLLLL